MGTMWKRSAAATVVHALVMISATVAQPAPQFKQPALFYTRDAASSTNPMGLAIADILGSDDFPEVVVVNESDQSVTVFQNTGDWTGDPPVNGLQKTAQSPIALGETPYDVDVADMDNQNGLDIVVTIVSTNEVAILYNNGSGVFAAPVFEPLDADTGDIHGLAISDFDNDGRKDVAVAGQKGTTHTLNPRVEVLWREASSAYTHTLVDFPNVFGGASGTEVIAGRFVGPAPAGRGLDLVTALTNAPGILCLRNQGNRTWIADSNAQAGVDGFGVAAGRFRTNGLPQPLLDVATTDFSGTDQTRVHWGDGTGLFDLQPGALQHASPAFPYGVDTGRINDDTKVDIVAARSTTGTTNGGIGIFLGNGDGTFGVTEYRFDMDPGTRPQIRFVKVADLNDDGFRDVVTSNYTTHRISVRIGVDPTP